MKALIIDDSRTDAYVCSKVATEFFSQVLVVGTPQELAEAFRTFKPDMVFVDVHIGNHNGIDLISEHRSRDDDSSITPMVVTTSSTDEATKKLADRFGATAFLSKPMTAEAMQWVIENHLVGYPGKPAQPGVINTKMFKV